MEEEEEEDEPEGETIEVEEGRSVGAGRRRGPRGYARRKRQHSKQLCGGSGVAAQIAIGEAGWKGKTGGKERSNEVDKSKIEIALISALMCIFIGER